MKEKPFLTIHDGSRTAIKADGTRIPVIDSRDTVYIQPSKEDIKKGIPGDHANCMYCVCVRRQFDSGLAWITRTLAYVEFLGKDGKPELRRFILSEFLRRQKDGKNLA
jgi:hypothetical protein